ncbi:MAG: cupin domain-containing protein [Actinomycetota bacterium]
MRLDPGPLQVIPDAFASHGEVMADIAELGFWPTTYVSDRSDEVPLHWHGADVCGYVLEGSSYILDADGVRHELRPGTKLVIPAGAVHAEGAVTERMVYVVATEPAENLMDVLLPLNAPDAEERPVGAA